MRLTASPLPRLKISWITLTIIRVRKSLCTVTNAVSLVLIKYYEIQDETGRIKVVTDNLLPARGEKLSVTGRTAVVELGTERWVVLRENADSTTQAVGSKNAEGGPLPQ